MSDIEYINYIAVKAKDRWGMRTFANIWWRLGKADRRWTPPPYWQLHRALNPANNPHLARLDPQFLHVEALPMRRKSAPEVHAPSEWVMVGAVLEVPLAVAIVAIDPRRRDRAAYLIWPHVRNDQTTLKRFLDAAWELLLAQGITRLIGPVGISPHLESGLLVDEWAALPPAHTAYNPPYLPDLIGTGPERLAVSRLWHLPVAAAAATPNTTPAQLIPLDPARLATDLLPLLATATASPHLPPPDAIEADFLLRWLRVPASSGWLAQVDGQPVGFVLLQPDQGQRLRQTMGGRSPLRWLWWQAVKNRPAPQGRLLFGGVLPAYRGRGIGTQLLQQAIASAHQHGWQKLVVGPVAEGNETAVSLLTRHHAIPRQTTHLYQWAW